MPTALQLVNRIRRKLRLPDTSDFAKSENLLLLDLVNEAINTVLELRDWDFDIRHDGHLTAVANSTGSGSGLSFGASGATMTINESLPASASPFVARIIFTHDTNYGDTAYRVSVWNGTTVTVPDANPDISTTSPTYSIFANEYVLPDARRKILSVRHQESDIRVEEVDRTIRFDRFVQRPQESITDTPDLIYVGGRGLATKSNAADADNDGLLFMPWPTPSLALDFDYSYLQRHDELTTTTDTLDNVDRYAVDLIVELAYGRSLQSDFGNNKEEGIAIERKVIGQSKEFETNDNRMPNRRLPLRSHDRSAGRIQDFGQLPNGGRTFGSLP